jgi:TRAP-type C4-dicarboxylate transport system permease small subunit
MKKILNTILKIDYVIAVTAVTALIGVTFFGVFMRYLFNSPFVWLEEVQMWLIIWVVFYGGAAAVRSGNHVSIEFIVERFPKNLHKMATLIQQYIKTSRVTNILHIPFVFIYSAVPIGCFLIVLNFILLAIEELTGKQILEEEAGHAN